MRQQSPGNESDPAKSASESFSLNMLRWGSVSLVCQIAGISPVRFSNWITKSQKPAAHNIDRLIQVSSLSKSAVLQAIQQRQESAQRKKKADNALKKILQETKEPICQLPKDI